MMSRRKTAWICAPIVLRRKEMGVPTERGALGRFSVEPLV
jgi:hypothetical protein